MKMIFKQCLIPLASSTISMPALADHDEQNSALQDAWLDGKLGTIVILNEHLNPLKIETDV